MAATVEFEQQDWVKQLTQNRGEHQPKKTHVNPNVAFPFQDDFSVGTIHEAKVTTPTQNMAEPTTTAEVLEIDNVDNNVSVLTAKTTSEKHTDSAVGRRVASDSNPMNGSTAKPTQPRTVSRGSADPTGADPESEAAWEPGANSPHCTPFYIHGGGGYTSARWTVKWAGILIKAQEEPATCI
jgi:hypothetical protein